MGKCKHRWHYVRKYFHQKGGFWNPKGYWYAKFICDKCCEYKIDVNIEGGEQ